MNFQTIELIRGASLLIRIAMPDSTDGYTFTARARRRSFTADLDVRAIDPPESTLIELTLDDTSDWPVALVPLTVTGLIDDTVVITKSYLINVSRGT